MIRKSWLDSFPFLSFPPPPLVFTTGEQERGTVQKCVENNDIISSVVNNCIIARVGPDSRKESAGVKGRCFVAFATVNLEKP